MGRAEENGALWSARARQWAELQEPYWRPVYAAVLEVAGVTSATSLLDIGCGGGGALAVAGALGADLTGLDAAPGMVAAARERVPGAEIRVGDMEALPFRDGAFDVVTGFTSFQFAVDPVRAFAEVRRVLKPRGVAVALLWGRREDCDLLAHVLPAVFALMPPPGDAAAPPQSGLADPGVLEAAMEKAGLAPTAAGDLPLRFEFADAETGWRSIATAGPVARAEQAAGGAVREAVLARLARFQQPDGSIVLSNRVVWQMAVRR